MSFLFNGVNFRFSPTSASGLQGSQVPPGSTNCNFSGSREEEEIKTSRGAELKMSFQFSLQLMLVIKSAPLYTTFCHQFEQFSQVQNWVFLILK